MVAGGAAAPKRTLHSTKSSRCPCFSHVLDSVLGSQVDGTSAYVAPTMYDALMFVRSCLVAYLVGRRLDS